MSNKVIKVLGGLIVGAALVAGAAQGCGGGGGGASSSDFSAACNKFCPTVVTCSGGLETMAACLQGCMAGASCSNAAAILAAGEKCENITDCKMLETCGGTIPDCVTGTGGTTGAGNTGGTTSGAGGSTGSGGTTAGSGGTTGSGTGGTTGSGGSASAGTTCDTACAKADQCCLAVEASAQQADGGQACTFKAMCDAETAANQASVVTICNMLLQEEAMLGANTPAGCK
jgi:hypothetical protein